MKANKIIYLVTLVFLLIGMIVLNVLFFDLSLLIVSILIYCMYVAFLIIEKREDKKKIKPLKKYLIGEFASFGFTLIVYIIGILFSKMIVEKALYSPGKVLVITLFISQIIHFFVCGFYLDKFKDVEQKNICRFVYAVTTFLISIMGIHLLLLFRDLSEKLLVFNNINMFGYYIIGSIIVAGILIFEFDLYWCRNFNIDKKEEDIPINELGDDEKK